jgi:23S rRNA (guanosine2251-2'-O)-methyltransferase
MAYLTGFHAIEEHLKNGRLDGARILLAKAGPRAREIVELARIKKVRIERVGTSDLDRIDAAHRGIALEVPGVENASPEITLESFLEELEAGDVKSSLVIICDEITDPHNYGAILRSADQFGADLVLSGKRRSAKNAAVISQTSAGASAFVPQAEAPNLRRAVERLKEAHFWVYGAEAKGTPVFEKELGGRTAIILGSEGAGISRLLREACDGFVSIPTCGRLDSLNVSVAAGILMYEAARQGSEFRD